MKSRVPLLLLTSAISLVALIHFQGCIQEHVPSRGATASVIVAEDELKLGSLWEGSRISRQIHIQNISQEEVNIQEFQKSCGCVSVTPASICIPANGMEVVNVTVDVPASASTAAAEELVQRIVPIVADTSAIIEPHIWEVRGRVRSLCELSASHVEIDESDSPLKKSRPVTVDLRSAEPLAAVEVLVEDAPVAASVSSMSSTDYKLTFEVRDMPNTPREFWGQAILRCHLSSGEIVTSRQLTVSGRLFRPVIASPAELKCGFVQVGKGMSRHLSLKSALPHPFSIHSVTSSSSEMVVTCNTTGRSDVHSATIYLNPLNAGLQKLTVEFVLEIADQDDLIKLHFPVEYFGVNSVSQPQPIGKAWSEK